MEQETIFIILISVYAGFCGGGFLFGVILAEDIELSQETADDICQQLTGNQTTVAEDTPSGTLICKLPSFDSTQNIIFKLNSE